MIHSTLKGKGVKISNIQLLFLAFNRHFRFKLKGMISSPYNQDFTEHKKFLINTFNKFGGRRSSLEVNCLQIIRENLNDYRNEIDHNFECVNTQIKNSLSLMTSETVFNMTFGIGMHDKKLFKPLADLITENFNSTGVAAAFNFIPLARIFKTYIMKNVVKCSEYLNVLISEKMNAFNEDIDDSDFEIKHATDESNIIECYLKELMNNDKFLCSFPMTNSSSSNLFNIQSKRLTEKRRSSITQNPNEKLKSNYKSFSFDHLSSLVQDLFLAGTETMSLSLNWAIIYAAYYPELQKEISDEIDRVLGSEKLPTESDRAKLPYVEAFINETLRYHCAGPILIPRSTTKDVIFRDYHLPANTFVMVNMWSCMRDPAYWEDADKFEPKRFIDSDGNYKCKNLAMMPFSVGKRACIGESIARLQMFLIFTSLMQKFHFSLASKKDALNKSLLLGIPGIGLNPPKISLKLTLR